MVRQRIFEAAVEEFAEHGSAGARVDRIAAKARANKESIYRYFGTKDELLRRVIDQYLDERGQAMLPQSIAECVRRIIAPRELPWLTAEGPAVPSWENRG